MKMNENKLVNGFFWRLAERIGAQGVTLLVTIVLARLLDPKVYGTVAIVQVFTTILQVFVDAGFGSALIQKKDADDIDFSTVFFFNIAMCSLLYVFIFCFAPYIASFYNMYQLTDIIRVMGLLIIISGVKSIQIAYVSRNMLFKAFFFSTLIGTVIAAFVGIWLAYAGFGVWALVIQNLVNQAVDTLVLWIVVKWRPLFVFSMHRLKQLFVFGGRILLSRIVETIYSKIRSLIIGIKFAPEELAYFEKGDIFPAALVSGITVSIDGVLFPTMSKVQDDSEKVLEITRQSVRISTYIMFPIMLGLVAVAKPLIILFLTEKWAPTVLYFQIFCIAYAFYPMHTSNITAMKSMGRSDMYFRLEMIKKIAGLAVVFLSIPFGVTAVAISTIITSIMSPIISAIPNNRLLNYKYRDQLMDVLPQMALSCIMMLIMMGVLIFNLNYLLTIVIQIAIGFATYYFGSIVFGLSEREICINLLTGIKKKIFMK